MPTVRSPPGREVPRGFDGELCPPQRARIDIGPRSRLADAGFSRAATGLTEPYFDTTSSTPTITTAEHPSDQADSASPARKYPSTSAMTGFT